MRSCGVPAAHSGSAGTGADPAALRRVDSELTLASVAVMSPAEALAALGSSDEGISAGEARRRLAAHGPNALRTGGVRLISVLARQLRSYLLLLLLAAAVISAVVGDRTEAVIIAAIMALSVGLSFLNEYRSERAVEALHAQIRHTVDVARSGAWESESVVDLVPGDVVRLRLGDVVPGDLQLLEARELECDESVLTGESRAAAKTAEPCQAGDSPLDLPSCAFMGTLIHAGEGRGVVVATGPVTAFGQIAARLGARHDLTSFQRGLAEFSGMLAAVTAMLASSIFLINAVLGRSLLQSGLFALAIAVGLTPQLLPAIVTVSLATGARRLARRRVIVKRLVCIEELGNIEVLFTDKTGTLTEGRTTFSQALGPDGQPDSRVLELGLLCSDQGGNELDRALWEAANGHTKRAGYRSSAAAPAGPCW